MKLSFSIQNWDSLTWSECCASAADAHLKGIELYNLDAPMLQGKSSPTNPELSAVTRRELVRQELSVPCVGTVGDFTSPDFAGELAETVEVAMNLGAENIVIHTGEGDMDVCEKAVAELLDVIGDQPVRLLVDTVGAYADTARLRDLLNRFADDRLCACWNMPETCLKGESAEQTITNLGAYTCHVHIHDYRVEDGVVMPELLGEGDMPSTVLMKLSFYAPEADITQMPKSVSDLEFELSFDPEFTSRGKHIELGQSVRLGEKELHILEYLIVNQGQVLTREQIALRIWGYESDSEYNNVEVYMSFARKKIAFVGSRCEIKAIRGIGYELRCRDVQ